MRNSWDAPPKPSKNVSKGEAQKVSTDDTMQQAIGYTKAKRQVAVSMGVDPYTTNSVLQKEMDGIAWASWAGGFAFSAATFPISGPVGAALTVTNVSGAIGDLLTKKSPAELKEINRSALRAMGASAKDAKRFLNNTAFTPTSQTQFVFNLKSLAEWKTAAPLCARLRKRVPMTRMLCSAFRLPL